MKEYKRNHRGHREKNISVFSRKKHKRQKRRSIRAFSIKKLGEMLEIGNTFEFTEGGGNV